jgi:hypothetical protein
MKHVSQMMNIEFHNICAWGDENLNTSKPSNHQQLSVNIWIRIVSDELISLA